MSHIVSLNWVTPNAEAQLVEDARISNPGESDTPDWKLISYLIRNHHWSPFEMVNMSVAVDTTRDIGRQLLRHWTLRPQELSQRYADLREFKVAGVLRDCRMKHPTNRQASIPCEDEAIIEWWAATQIDAWERAIKDYGRALDRGIAKEVARAILPEGMTPTKMKFNGNLRTWIHFWQLRSGHGTQPEATLIASGIRRLLSEHFPLTCQALDSIQ